MKQLIALVLLLGMPGLLLADYRCSICKQEGKKLYAIRDMSGAEKTMVCARCYKQTPRCNVCGLPVKQDSYTTLSDGRLLCNDDKQNGIFSQKDLEEVFRQTKQELERTFYRFSMVFPATNVTVRLADANQIEAVIQSIIDRNREVYSETEGLTVPTYYSSEGKIISPISIRDNNAQPARAEYKIYVLSGMPRSRTMAICAHEYGHVWHLENLVQRSYHLDPNTKEAFCELLAYQLMDAMMEPFEKAVIEANLYTEGKVDLLLESEKEYGFYKLLEWMKNGTDFSLNQSNLDRIRVVNAPNNVATVGSPLAGFVNIPIKVPDKLMLKGIMGSGKKRMALINNQTFEISEKAKVKVAKTNVTVEMVEIREASVLIRTNNVSEPVEIFLQK